MQTGQTQVVFIEKFADDRRDADSLFFAGYFPRLCSSVAEAVVGRLGGVCVCCTKAVTRPRWPQVHGLVRLE